MSRDDRVIRRLVGQLRIPTAHRVLVDQIEELNPVLVHHGRRAVGKRSSRRQHLEEIFRNLSGAGGHFAYLFVTFIRSRESTIYNTSFDLK